jgi:hypothetical protein
MAHQTIIGSDKIFFNTPYNKDDTRQTFLRKMHRPDMIKKFYDEFEGTDSFVEN